MTLQWFDSGEAELTALGTEYNYTAVCEFGRNRLWKINQHWHSVLLKATWRETAAEAQAQAQAWEDAHDPDRIAARSRSGRILSAARSTRATRQRLTRTFATQQKGRS